MTSFVQHPKSFHPSANQTRWFKHYGVYLGKTDRQQRLKDWMEQEFESQVVDPLHGRVAGETGDDEPLRVLGIGSAEEYQEILQLKNLTTRFSTVRARVVEPIKELIQQYQETVRKTSQGNGECTSHVEYHWYNETFQDYIKKYRVAEKYHFISAVHSIYYIWDDDLDKTIRELYEMLEPGGTLFMVLWRAHTGMSKVANLAKALQNHNLLISNGSTTTTLRNVITSEDVKAVLDKKQIAYVQSEYTESVDITTCLTKEDSNTGEHLLDLMTQTFDFKKTVSDEVYKQVMDFIKDHMRVAKCTPTDLNMNPIQDSVEAIFRLYEKYSSGDYIGEPVSQTEHMVQCAMLAEADGCPDEVILGALFHDIGHLIGLERSLPRMETDDVRLGIQNHDKIGAQFLRDHGLPEMTCQMVKGHVNAKRYLVFKDKVYHDGLSDASKMTLVHQGGPMTAQEAEIFESSPAFESILRMRKWDERAKDPSVEIQPLSKYRQMCTDLLCKS